MKRERDPMILRLRCLSVLLIGLCAFLAFIASVSKGAEALEFDGLIEPHRVIKVGSGVPGVIERVEVDRGDFVKKGQLLASMQSGVEKASVEAAQARAEMLANIKAKEENLSFSLREQERTEQLYKKELLPPNKMDEVKTNRVLAEMQLKDALENKRLAELELKRASEVVKRLNIYSPVNGVVVERFLSPGEYIETEAILKIAEIDPLNVEIIVPVVHLASIRVGMKAKVIPEAPVRGQYTAEVKIVDQVVDAASGTFGVRLELPNPDHRLPAGLKCRVVFGERKAKGSGKEP